MITLNFLIGRNNKWKVAKKARNLDNDQLSQVRKAMSDGKLITAVKG